MFFFFFAFLNMTSPLLAKVRVERLCWVGQGLAVLAAGRRLRLELFLAPFLTGRQSSDHNIIGLTVVPVPGWLRPGND